VSIEQKCTADTMSSVLLNIVVHMVTTVLLDGYKGVFTLRLSLWAHCAFPG
jgi:hypothetical protein